MGPGRYSQTPQQSACDGNGHRHGSLDAGGRIDERHGASTAVFVGEQPAGDARLHGRHGIEQLSLQEHTQDGGARDSALSGVQGQVLLLGGSVVSEQVVDGGATVGSGSLPLPAFIETPVAAPVARSPHFGTLVNTDELTSSLNNVHGHTVAHIGYIPSVIKS